MNTSYWDDCYRSRSRCSTDDCDGWLDGYAKFFHPGCRALDLGCGAGTNLEELLALGARVTAADFSPDAVRLVSEGFGSRLEGADCFDMRLEFPYGSGEFDVVAADLSLHYFRWRETEAIVREIGRVLKPGGTLLARVHSIDNLKPGEAVWIEKDYYLSGGYPRRYFTIGALRTLFEGWDVHRMEEKIANRYGKRKKIIEFAVGVKKK